MIQALWTAGAGLIAQQYNVDTIANDVANADTTAFKRSIAHMEDMPYVYRLNPMIKNVPNEGVLPHVGTGVNVASFSRYFGQGAMQQTDRKLDLAIEGPGFFAVTDGQANVFYTRDGDFEITPAMGPDGQTHGFLTTAGGYWVLDAEGNRIQLPDDVNMDDVVIGSDGTIKVGSDNIASIALVEFVNPGGLASAGNNLYAMTANAGNASLTGGDSKVHQGFLEASNVDIADEMTRMIQAQRVYELNARVLQAADEMIGLANSIRR